MAESEKFIHGSLAVSQDCLTIAICVWVTFSRDWQKNVLAVGALWFIIAANVIHILLSVGAADGVWQGLGYYMALSPVMFHTTAPVHRSIRITITLYAIFSALLLRDLSASQELIFYVIVFLALLPMTSHWRKNRQQM